MLSHAKEELLRFPENILRRNAEIKRQLRLEREEIEAQKSNYNQHTYDTSRGHVIKTRSATPSPVRNRARDLDIRMSNIEADTDMHSFWKGMVHQLQTAYDNLAAKKEAHKARESEIIAPRSNDQIVVTSTDPMLKPGDPFVKGSSRTVRHY